MDEGTCALRFADRSTLQRATCFPHVGFVKVSEDVCPQGCLLPRSGIRVSNGMYESPESCCCRTDSFVFFLPCTHHGDTKHRTHRCSPNMTSEKFNSSETSLVWTADRHVYHSILMSKISHESRRTTCVWPQLHHRTKSSTMVPLCTVFLSTVLACQPNREQRRKLWKRMSPDVWEKTPHPPPFVPLGSVRKLSKPRVLHILAYRSFLASMEGERILLSVF